MTGCKLIDAYIADVKSGKELVGRRLKKAIKQIEKQLKKKNVTVDSARAEQAVFLMEEKFGFELFPWERFVVGLVHCYDDRIDMVIFREFLIVMGRGNGKNGFISALIWYLVTPYHGVEGYDVDIIANSEEQATRSFLDVYKVLEDEKADNPNEFKKHWYLSKTEIRNLDTDSYIRFNTSNSRTKDSKRTACLIVDEEHEYESGKMIGAFESGFGKKRHSRIFKISTNGFVRDGQLDNDLKIADQYLDGDLSGLPYTALVYECDSDAEVLRPEMWPKANPSLKYLPLLRQEMNIAFVKTKHDSEVELNFYTKRCNRPRVNRDVAVATVAEIKATNREMPDLAGFDCVAGIDYALLSDMASVGLLFRVNNTRYWMQHSWICKSSKDYDRIKAPLEEWEARGDLTIVDGPQIPPTALAEWLFERMRKYNIKKLALDNARYALMREVLEGVGFVFETSDLAMRNVWLVRPLGIASAAPVIESWFKTESIVTGDLPLFRWAVNNTKKVTMKSQGASGNYKYDKIEARSRKTDPFMAFVHAAVIDKELADTSANSEAWDMPDSLI